MFRRWLTGISAVFFVIVVLAFAYVSLFKGQTDLRQQAQLKTAIIYQLSRTHPNRTFWCTARTVFNESGYEIYYFMGGADTIDFYRTLPERDFKVIILRLHSAIHLESGDLAIFTSEGWDDGRASTTYLADILNDGLAKVSIDVDSPEHFGITPNFVRAMRGNLNTFIIMMGCQELIGASMAEVFIQKGAEAYIGWTGP